jgi:serine-type D-Ala-D-Ala carboxypeptidase (penicillin-binding protein 5/6)
MATGRPLSMAMIRMTLSLRRRALCFGLLASALIGALAGATAFAAPAPKPGEPFQTAAPNAILMEADGGSVLFEKNADTLIPPASLSKMMTAEFVFNEIKQGTRKPSDEFIVSTNAWRTGGAPSHTSSMFIPIHSRVSIDDLLRGLIIQSANDAAIVLAEGIAGSEDKFAELMTARAREIGLDKATFGNSNGLPNPRQLMTARELGKLAQHLIRTYPDQYKLYSEREYTFNKIRQFNRNPLLTMNIGADGLKTGFTKEAGYGLVGSAVQNGLRLIVVVNGLKTEKERADEAKRLLEWGFHNFQLNLLFEEGQIIADAKTFGGDRRNVALVAQRPVRLMMARGVRERIIARVVYSGPVRAPVQKGRKVGILKVWRGDVMVLEVPLEAAEDVGTGTIPGRAWDAASELLYGLFRAGVQKL